MTKKEGPFIQSHKYLSCGFCKWLEREMIQSGRQPIYHFYCKHPQMIKKEHESKIMGRDVRYIGESWRTPSWCPAKEGNKK